MLSPICRTTLIVSVLLAVLPSLQAQSAPSTDSKTIPVIDGGIGPCSADFAVTDSAGAPVYAATIRVHIAYGFMSLLKLDLEVGTNAAGKARFTGLPSKTKQGLFFRIFKDGLEGSAFDEPSKTCKAEFTVPLEKKSPTAQLHGRSAAQSGEPERLLLELPARSASP